MRRRLHTIAGILLGLCVCPVSTEEVQATNEEGQVTRVYFGDLHVHTAFSLDSYIFANDNHPDAAYRFAQGEKLTLYGGQSLQLPVPLDFVAVTDHAEFMGELQQCTRAGNSTYHAPACQAIRARDMREFFRLSRSVTTGERQQSICTGNVAVCTSAAACIWSDIRRAAERHNNPGTFTTLLGFEFSDNIAASTPEALKRAVSVPGMLHRNVIFRSATVPDNVFSAYEGDGEALWRWLDKECELPCQAMTIPHNSNYSWGRFFSPGKNSNGTPWDETTLYRRNRMERLLEIFQIKGSSECQPGVGMADEDCGFEITVPACGQGQTQACADRYSYARDALVSGLQVKVEYGVNPFKLGVVAATDNHNGTPGAVIESDFKGHLGQQDYTARQRLGLDDKAATAQALRRFNPGGLTGVWSRENTRSALWDALYRREVYATSGPRIRVQLFAGFNLPRDLHQRQDRSAQGYALAVPMGGELSHNDTQSAPLISLWASQDPRSEPLHKLQIVKGWLQRGVPVSRVYDVTCAVGVSPDPETGRCPASRLSAAGEDLDTPEEEGAPNLSVTWQDPDFDAKVPAVYYARVFEIASYRWTHYDQRELGLETAQSEVIQERAWTSPVWYAPDVPLVQTGR